jgi:predicted aspartyl protease
LRFRFLELPGEPVPRPFVPVVVAGIEHGPLACLVDTGALRNVFARWIAEEAGIPLLDAPAERLAAGGLVTEARIAWVDLTVGDVRLDAAVWFCDPWPFAFNLLGQEGFLRFFHLELCTDEGWLDLVPEPHA